MNGQKFWRAFQGVQQNSFGFVAKLRFCQLAAVELFPTFSQSRAAGHLGQQGELPLNMIIHGGLAAVGHHQ